MKYLNFIKKNLIYILPFIIWLWIIYGNYFETSFLKKFVLLFTFIMIYPQMVNLNFKQLFEKPNIKLKLASLWVNFILIPLLAFMLSKIFFSNDPMNAVWLFLIALLPTGSMTLAFTWMAKGNLSAAIRISVFSLLLSAILTPLYLLYFMWEVVTIDFLMISKKILLVIILPWLLWIITRYFVIKKTWEKDFKIKFWQKIWWFSSLWVIAMIFSIMAMKSQFIINNPTKILFYLIPLSIFYISIYIISIVLWKKFFHKKDAIALVFSTALRNLSIALAIAMTSFGEKGTNIALIISIAFILQIKFWYIFSKYTKNF